MVGRVVSALTVALMIGYGTVGTEAQAGGTMLYKTVDKNGNVVYTDRPPAGEAQALIADESKKTGPALHSEVATKLYCGELQVSFARQQGESVAEALARLRTQKKAFQTEQDNSATVLRMHSKKLAVDNQDNQARVGAQKASKEMNEYRCAVAYLSRWEVELQTKAVN